MRHLRHNVYVIYVELLSYPGDFLELYYGMFNTIRESTQTRRTKRGKYTASSCLENVYTSAGPALHDQCATSAKMCSPGGTTLSRQLATQCLPACVGSEHFSMIDKPIPIWLHLLGISKVISLPSVQPYSNLAAVSIGRQLLSYPKYHTVFIEMSVYLPTHR